jgi:hypothetical protein
LSRYRLYERSLKSGPFLKFLSGQEKILNFFFNIAFAIAPDDVVSRLLCTPLEIRHDGANDGPFETFGARELAARFKWGEANVTQPDGFFTTKKSVVAVELKLDSPSSLEQIVKYIALMRWEQNETGQRDNLGLLFILPERSIEPNWSKVGLNDPSGSGVRRCPPDFFYKLNRVNSKGRVRELFKEQSKEIRRDIERLHLAAVSWTWLRDEISKIESELDPEARGDQTLKRLLAGLRAQVEAHGNTGIVKGRL